MAVKGREAWPAEAADQLLCFLLHTCDVANQVRTVRPSAATALYTLTAILKVVADTFAVPY